MLLVLGAPACAATRAPTPVVHVAIPVAADVTHVVAAPDPEPSVAASPLIAPPRIDPEPDPPRPRFAAHPFLLADLPKATVIDRAHLDLLVRAVSTEHVTGITKQAVLRDTPMGMVKLGPWVGWHGKPYDPSSEGAFLSCTEGITSVFPGDVLWLKSHQGHLEASLAAVRFRELTCDVEVLGRAVIQPKNLFAPASVFGFRSGDGETLELVLPRVRRLRTDGGSSETGSFTFVSLPIHRVGGASLLAELPAASIASFQQDLGLPAKHIEEPIVTVGVDIVQGALDAEPIATLYSDVE